LRFENTATLLSIGTERLAERKVSDHCASDSIRTWVKKRKDGQDNLLRERVHFVIRCPLLYLPGTELKGKVRMNARDNKGILFVNNKNNSNNSCNDYNNNNSNRRYDNWNSCAQLLFGHDVACVLLVGALQTFFLGVK